MTTLSIEPTREDSTGLSFKCIGALTRNAAQTFRHFEQELLAKNPRVIHLDIEQIKHISGEGMMQWVIFCTRMVRRGCQINVSGMNSAQEAVFDLTRLSTLLQCSKPEPSPQYIRWTAPIRVAQCEFAPKSATNRNVHGRKLTSPLDGFGRMWLRTYRILLPASKAPSVEVMQQWKQKFSNYWPPGNAFYTPDKGIFPGAVGLINLTMPLGLKLATGAVVIYEDESSFTLMTVQGHMFSGFINFSVFSEGEKTIVQTQALIRPNDLLYEMSFWFGFGPKAEDQFWADTLRNLAAAVLDNPDAGATIETPVELSSELIDRQIQWRAFTNIFYNAGIHSAIYQFTKPLRKMRNEKREQGNSS